MQITIDGREFELEARKVDRDIRQVGELLRQGVLKVSLSAKRMIQLRMPVDTGRAKSSWGNVPAAPPALANEGIWEVKDDGMTIIQGSRVPYIERLNEGHSSQAPAGFIDAEEAAAAASLEKELGEVLLTGWGTG
jgi:hypothetical protein